MAIKSCPVCDDADRTSVYSIAQFPTYHVLPDPLPPAHTKFAPVDICMCNHCGHLFNGTFDPELGDALYASALPTNVAVHPTMSQAVTDLSDFVRLISPKTDATVLEVGGGYADLSRAMCSWAKDVFLVEPNPALSAVEFPEKNLHVVNSAFPAPGISGPFDVVVCKQVLEHISNPVEFLSAIRPYMSENGVFYLEVPSLDYVINNGSLVDFHYPHVQYFSEAAIKHAARRAGFSVAKSSKIKLDHDAYYLLEPGQGGPLPLAPAPSSALTLAKFLSGKFQAAETCLATLPPRRALYGACAYSQSLMGAFPEFSGIDYIFDDTPGFDGHRTYSVTEEMPVGFATSDILSSLDCVVITTYMHDKVVSERLRALGFDGQIVSVRADSNAGKDGHPETVFLQRKLDAIRVTLSPICSLILTNILFRGTRILRLLSGVTGIRRFF